jgi:transketolase
MEKKIINTLRTISVDMVQKSNSGHPGMCLGCAPMMFVLWCKIMNFNPSDPFLINRDRFILSNGHGCALLYSILYLLGYNYELFDLQNFRQIHSKTPGHPEMNVSHGIEITTGPLGQGIANGVGMAIASKKLGIDNFIYVMCGDGCLMEGVSYEAASLAGHLELNNLILLYDDNGITIDGTTDLTFTEDTRGRFVSFKWNVLEVNDGDNDIEDIYNNLLLAKKSIKPTIIFVKTTIGFGSINSGTSSVHGAPLGENNVKKLKNQLNFDENVTFFIDEDVKQYFLDLKNEKIAYFNDNNLSLYENNIDNIINEIKKIKNEDKNYASRDSSSIVLNKISELTENIIVGSADLAESNKTMIHKGGIINKHNFKSKYLHYGIREHSMIAIANGISTCGILPVVSTFLVFITYCLAPIRMAALSRHKIICVFTHDSIFLGEDGPTHQPIESLTILRSIPNLLTIRPCDVNEVSGAYQIALKHEGPTSIIMSRQVLPNIHGSCMEKMKMGAYIVYKNHEKDCNFIIIATGSEVSLAIDIAKTLRELNINIVSMPSCELYDLQPKEYKDTILPKKILKMSIEAGSTIGWYKYANYAYGIDTFGSSGKINDLKEYYGFTVEKIVSYIKNI